MRAATLLLGSHGTCVSSFVTMVLLLVQSYCLVGAQETRLISIGGPLPATYLGQRAAFGNPLEKQRMYNLMLPPDDPWLCEFSPSLQNVTMSLESRNTTNGLVPHREVNRNPEPVALFVSVNQCSAETKARVAVQIQKQITDRLELLILYSPDPRSTSLVTLVPDSEDSNTSDINNLAMLYVPYRYAAGIDSRMRMTWTGRDPRFLIDDNDQWSFNVEISEYRGDFGGDSSYAPGDTPDNIYWFRIILFSLLILSPCCRACYLWYAGGGRFYWQRNENGRIVGIQYIPPVPAWMSPGRPSGDSAEAQRTTTLTEAEFNALPEIEFKPSPLQFQYQEDDDANATTKEQESENRATKPSASSKEENGVEVSEPDLGAVGLNTSMDSEMVDEMERGDGVPSPLVEEGPSSNKTPESPLGTGSKKSVEETSRKGSPSAKSEGAVDEEINDPLATRSTMCSICIDDFEVGEKLILLPRCQHAFHKECIHPWLTERQGCCPFCKTEVLDTAQTDSESSSQSGQDSDSPPNGDPEVPLSSSQSNGAQRNAAQTATTLRNSSLPREDDSEPERTTPESCDGSQPEEQQS